MGTIIVDITMDIRIPVTTTTMITRTGPVSIFDTGRVNAGMDRDLVRFFAFPFALETAKSRGGLVHSHHLFHSESVEMRDVR
jgi:hypothetical protein